MASTTDNKGWIQRTKERNFQSRMRRIQSINDPTTSADELLFWSKILINILLIFTGCLALSSYYKNFSQSFPWVAALLMGLALTIAIEFGKNYCSRWSIRTVFFRWQETTHDKASSIMFAGITLVAIITFVISGVNSTIGGHQLSSLLAHQRDTTLFVASTADIDAQLSAAQNNIDQARQTKWKGTTTRMSQKTIDAQTQAVLALNKQKQDIIEQQRADWTKRQAIRDSDNAFSANSVLAAGGWVELLQLILMIARVACEKVLHDKNPETETDAQPSNGIGFRRQSGYRTATAEHTTPPATGDAEPRRPIGFRRYDNPPPDTVPPPTVTAKNAVEQCTTAFSPGTAPTEQPAEQRYTARDQASLIADVKDWKKRAKQCLDRAITQQRPEYRQDNERRHHCYSIMLQAVGVRVKIDEHGRLTFQDPDRYIINDLVVEIIMEQQDRLSRIGAERRGGAA